MGTARSLAGGALTVAVLALVVGAGCKKGSKRAARQVGERVPGVVVPLESALRKAPVDASAVSYEAVEEIVSHVWFVTATVAGSPDPRPWRCFFDLDDAWCDKGEGTIFTKLVQHRRLGGNRGAVDDPAWVQFLVDAYDLKIVWPDKGFPLPDDSWRTKLRIREVVRPKDGGVTVSIDAFDAESRIVRVRANVTPEDAVDVTRTTLLDLR